MSVYWVWFVPYEPLVSCGIVDFERWQRKPCWCEVCQWNMHGWDFWLKKWLGQARNSTGWTPDFVGLLPTLCLWYKFSYLLVQAWYTGLTDSIVCSFVCLHCVNNASCLFSVRVSHNCQRPASCLLQSHAVTQTSRENDSRSTSAPAHCPTGSTGLYLFAIARQSDFVKSLPLEQCCPTFLTPRAT